MRMLQRRKNCARDMRVGTMRVVLVVGVALFLLTVLLSRSPGYLVAEDLGGGKLAEVLRRAEAALEKKRWQRAVEGFQEACDLTTAATRNRVQGQLQWSRAHLAIETRYSDGSLAELIKKTDRHQALAYLQETLKLIDEQYYRKLARKEWLSQALLQVQASLESDDVARQFGVDSKELETLRRAVAQSREEAEQNGEYTVERILQLASAWRAPSDEAGLGAAWPAIALSYACADSVDQYSYVLSPAQYEKLRDQLNGFYVGVGVELVMTERYPTVFDVIKDSPADAVGIVPGDVLLSVGEESLEYKSEPQVSKLLLGEPGSYLRVEVRRGEDQLAFIMPRSLLTSPTVRYSQLIETDEGIGYVRIASFDYDTAMELRRALDGLNARGARAYVIDLRGNGGGLMRSAIDAVRLFLNTGTIVTVESGTEKTRYCAGGDGYRSYEQPIVLLVDENTASAAEIFAAALQDNRRAAVIGRKTFGKALVQTVYDLKNSKTALCITTASYKPPSNISFGNTGITPDVLIETFGRNADKSTSMADYLSENDPVLRRGIALLKRANNS